MKRIDLNRDQSLREGIADEIKASVTMPELIAAYTTAKPRFGRIPCPIHNGHDYNFSFTDKFYKCFVCGASGDVIRFTEEMCGVDYVGALRRLNEDFNLNMPLDYKPTSYEASQINERMKERREAAAKRQAETDEYEAKYNVLWDLYIWMDRDLRKEEPGSPLWCVAAKNIDRISYLINAEL